MSCGVVSRAPPPNLYVETLSPCVLLSGGGSLWGDEVVRVEPSGLGLAP